MFLNDLLHVCPARLLLYLPLSDLKIFGDADMDSSAREDNISVLSSATNSSHVSEMSGTRFGKATI